MAYDIEILPSAVKEIRKLGKPVRQAISEAINDLADDPYPEGVKKLRYKKKTIFRIRVGDYRIAYQVENGKLKIVVVKVAHRREIYKRLLR